MQCTHCRGDNEASFLVCRHCHRPRVIKPPGGGTTATLTPPATRHRTATMPVQPAVIRPPAAMTRPAQATPAAPVSAVPVPGGAPNFARDATRYMCAAVQLDSMLNRRVLDGTVFERHRAVASSPGVDMATVLKYAVAGRRRQRTTDALLLVLLPFFTFFGVGFLLAWLVVTVERVITSYGVLAPYLRRNVFDPSAAPEPSSPRVRKRIADIGARDRGNVTVYPGYSPFVGFGGQVSRWSFVADLSKPAPGETVRRFVVKDLHDHVAAQVSALGLPGVTVDDRLFVSGEDLLDGSMPAVAPEILPDPLDAPRQQVGDHLIQRLWDTPQDRARPYLALRVTGWSGELVLTMFVRFVQQRDELLFVEAEYLLLAPLDRSHHSVDQLRERPTVRQVVRIAGEAFRPALIRQITSPYTVTKDLFRPVRGWFAERREQREIIDDRTFNYGAPVAPRELAADRQYHRRFQEGDKDMYLKIIERRVLDSLETFFDQHGIDSSDIHERQMMILNAGLMVTGNAQVTANSIAAGAGARSSSAGGTVTPAVKGG
jgi:hypothetical protein